MSTVTEALEATMEQRHRAALADLATAARVAAELTAQRDEARAERDAARAGNDAAALRVTELENEVKHLLHECVATGDAGEAAVEVAKGMKVQCDRMAAEVDSLRAQLTSIAERSRSLRRPFGARTATASPTSHRSTGRR